MQYLSIHVARIVFAASILETIVIEKKKERKGKERNKLEKIKKMEKREEK